MIYKKRNYSAVMRQYKEHDAGAAYGCWVCYKSIPQPEDHAAKQTETMLFKLQTNDCVDHVVAYIILTESK